MRGSPLLLALESVVRIEELLRKLVDRVLDRRTDRLVVSRGALLSLGQAAELMPMDDGAARTWLESRGLVRHIVVSGRTSPTKVVRWGDVLDALERPDERARTASLPRVKLL